MQPGHRTDVLDHGYVEYLGHYGDDRMICRVARTSTTGTNKSAEEDRKLLRYLFVNRHTSPFEQAMIQWEVKLPIFVMRQLVRHRTFKLNEFSMRYSRAPAEFYVPSWFRRAGSKNKQGSVEDIHTDPWVDTDGHKHTSKDLQQWLTVQCSVAFETYDDLLEVGVAREQARSGLPVNAYTKITLVTDIHNLMHFLYLRTHEHAQWEMRQYAWAMAQVFRELFPWTAALWATHVPIMQPRASVFADTEGAQ